jgi:sigma-E factor negative regulatory protein RseC
MDRLISHPGSVRRIVDGRALVAVAASGCASCGHGAACGIGKLAGGRAETLLALPAPPGLRAGDAVHVELREAQLTRAALLGYLLPVLLIVAGALLGQELGEKLGADETTALQGGRAKDALLAVADGGTVDGFAALGAVAGLAFGLLLTRLHRPPALRLVPAGASDPVFPLEKSHV